VIATGGSVVYSDEAMTHLKQRGCCVFLSVPLNALEKRLNNITTRGIAMSPTQSLKNLFDERQLLYKKYADVTIDCSTKTVESIVTDIVTQFKKCTDYLN
jgi:shikimate kinase